ncbi:MAG TPA: hypothetical protein VGX68_11660, partial [Thermoanaerobaculia bacterium]|nr:hypothetical protein [Thermoanaerobaculia bacterium]
SGALLPIIGYTGFSILTLAGSDSLRTAFEISISAHNERMAFHETSRIFTGLLPVRFVDPS